MATRILDTLTVPGMRAGWTEGGKPRPSSPFIDSCQASQLESFTRTKVDIAALAAFSIAHFLLLYTLFVVHLVGNNRCTF